MDWFQSKTGQIIALVSIVGTLAGFGYTGATYVNRLENLEAKIGGVDEAEDEMKIIEERFASIETSVQFLEKEIDNINILQATRKAMERAIEDIVKKYNIKEKEVAFLSANTWDVSGGGNYGFKAIWVNRNNAIFDNLDYTPKNEINNLKQLLDIV